METKNPLRKSVVSNEVIDKRDFAPCCQKTKEGQVFIDPTGRPMAAAYIARTIKRP